MYTSKRRIGDGESADDYLSLLRIGDGESTTVYCHPAFTGGSQVSAFLEYGLLQLQLPDLN